MNQRDAVVIGAGPAGLAAAVYLARFHRSVLVLDGGPSRASWIPESHNTPGFPHGVGGEELLSRLRAQALEFGVEIRKGRVQTVDQAPGGFRLQGPAVDLQAQTVLLATGVVDRLPEIPGVEAAVRRSLVRMCPICDAFEATGKKIAVLGDGGRAQREADFLRAYSDRVTVIGLNEGRLKFDEAAIRWTPPRGTAPQVFDHLYLALGCEPQTALAIDCGAGCDDDGALLVDAHQMTSVDGLYAAGDAVRGLNQIAVATGEAAIAATAMHNRLRRRAKECSPRALADNPKK